MKKITEAISALSLFFLAALTISCAEEIIEPDSISQPDEDVLVDVCISASQEKSGTKVELAEGNVINWQESDCIALLKYDGYPWSFPIVSGAGTTKGTFSGKLPESAEKKDFIAIYPYNDYHSIAADGTVTVRWEENNIGAKYQVATPGGFWPGSSLMAGKVDENGDVQFKNLVAYIKFSIDFPCTEMSFTSNKSEYLASKAVSFSFGDDGVPVDIQKEFGVQSNGYDTIYLKGMDGDYIAAGTYLIAVLPQTLEEGLTVKVTSAASGLQFTKTFSKPMVLKRSGILNIGTFSISDFIGNSSFEGQGTEANPYLISDISKLQLLANVFSAYSSAKPYSGKYFKQTSDIDCEGNAIAIGRFGTAGWSEDVWKDVPFDGTYDGNGHTISNYRLKLYQDVPLFDLEYQIAALFPYVKDATIKNLTVSPYKDDDDTMIMMEDTDEAYFFVSPLIGFAATSPYVGSLTTLSRCHLVGGPYVVRGRTEDDSSFANQSVTFGGLVSRVLDHLTLDGCTNEADIDVISGFSNFWGSSRIINVGGLIGEAVTDGENYDKTLTISNCRNHGDLSLDSKYDEVTLGGLLGYVDDIGFSNFATYMWNCVNSGAVIIKNGVEDAYAGGLVGWHDSDGYYSGNYDMYDPWIYNCLNTGHITATGSDSSAGGIIGAGYDTDLVLALCVNAGDIYGNHRGALCGRVESLLHSYPAYCYCCFWADESNTSTPYIPIMYGTPAAGTEYGKGEYFDCIFKPYDALIKNPDLMNNKIKVFDASKTNWTGDDWLQKAARWITAKDESGASVLDLDFGQRVD